MGISIFVLVTLLLSGINGQESRWKRQISFGPEPNDDTDGPAPIPCSTARGLRGTCQPLTACAAFVPDQTQTEAPEFCALADGSTGACCPEVDSPEGTVELLRIPQRVVPVQTLSVDQLRQGGVAGSNEVDGYIELEKILLQNDVLVKQETPSFGHFQFFRSSRNATEIAMGALRVVEATRQLKNQFSLTAEQATSGLSQNSFLDTTLRDVCPKAPRCRPNAKYRTVDGSCNNLQNPLWGRSLTVLQRLLPPQYGDGVWSPRRSLDGSELPSPRLVSVSAISDADIPRNDLSLMVMLWGQWIDHDLDLAPIFVFQNGSGIECCTSNGQFLPQNRRHPQCLPIEIPTGDPFYGRLNRRCMNFVRSMPGPRPDCTFGYAEQLNDPTHYIDASQVYGSTEATARGLRSFQGGRLRATTSRSGRDNLLTNSSSDCEMEPCFVAGDVRVREQPQLTVMHTLWLREHNRIANELSRLNPRWNDETIYQETRRIVIAQQQHITYNEFLPIILGRNFMETYGLITPSRGYYLAYDSNINPSINNEFAAAAYRMGHSLVQGILSLFGVNGKLDRTFTLSSVFNDASNLLVPGWLDSATRGLIDQPLQNFDSSMSSELTTKLFRGRQTFGMDLASLNIQRARDHGIPGYNFYRELCGLGRARTFDELIPLINPQMVEVFRRLYRTVDDIDLFVGGLAETHVPGALLGPTFVCIVGDQFARLKKGDRYFFDIGGQPHSFTPAQLNELRKASLARVICDNTDGTVQVVQPLVFRTATGANRKVPCNGFSVPRIDLSAWAGERV